jgi:Fe-S-cluster-containing dehydrogenase component
MKQKYLIVDVARCHDCNNCFMGCKDEHVDNDWPGYTLSQPRHGHRWMNIQRRERGVFARNDVAYLPMPCQHCGDAPCIKAANGAITRREDGIVMIDVEKAKGKKDLVESCPYGAIYWNEEKNVPQKCTMCAHLLDDKSWKPGMPRCAHNCPTGALTYIEAEPSEIDARIASGELQAYKAELETKPHVLYKNLYKFTKNFVSAGVLVNGDCFEGAIATLKAKTGKIVCKPAGASAASCTDTSTLATQRTNFFGEFKFDGLEDGKYTLEIDAAGKKYSSEIEIAGKSLNLGFIEL